jgi:hypothetical protein
MTQKEAKDLSLEVWRYLRDHPEIPTKSDLPDYLLEQIDGLVRACPLCEIFTSCEPCPLTECGNDSSTYGLWLGADTDMERQEAAAEIVRRIEAWKPGVEE